MLTSTYLVLEFTVILASIWLYSFTFSAKIITYFELDLNGLKIRKWVQKRYKISNLLGSYNAAMLQKL